MNTSATGGYLAPAATPAPLEDDAFTDFLQAILVGISGLPGNRVFPRWQPQPPNLPAKSIDWAALGITNFRPQTFAVELHTEDGDEIQRHEEIDILTSFYGPHAWGFASQFRDGLQVSQNRYALQAAGMGLVDTGELINAPQLLKELWTQRVDMRWTIRRAIQRKYPVLSLLSAQVTLIVADTEDGSITENIVVPVPPLANTGRLDIDFVLDQSVLAP